MKHKFFYGAEPKFTEADKGNFSREGYEARLS